VSVPRTAGIGEGWEAAQAQARAILDAQYARYGGVDALAARLSPDQEALSSLVDEMTLGGRKPLSVADANMILDWADEVNYPGWRAKAGDVGTPSNWVGGPHIHIPNAGRGGHVPVLSGVAPR
jgi:hypothetical protein